MIKPKRLKLWNVEILHDGKSKGRIQVVADEKDSAGTIELRVKTYYQSITKKHIKVTAKAKPSQNRKLLLHF